MKKFLLPAFALALVFTIDAGATIEPPMGIEWGADYGSVLSAVAKDGMVWGEDIDLTDDNDIRIWSLDYNGNEMTYGIFSFDDSEHLEIFAAGGFVSLQSLSSLCEELDGCGTLQSNSIGQIGDDECTFYWKDDEGASMSLDSRPGPGGFYMVTLSMFVD